VTTLFRNKISFFVPTNFSFATHIITEATTCLTTNLNASPVIGCRETR